MERTKCEGCGGKIEKKDVEYKLFDVGLGRFSAQVCAKCGEVYTEETSAEMTRIAKEKGLWGLSAKTTVGR